MDYDLPDGNGRKDHPPGAHQRRFAGGGHGFIHRRSIVIGASQLPHRNRDMETEIHHVEQEAYTSVLRAFKAQSDAITWEKESLITELRKELRVSDEEHRILLSRVNADDIIRQIRDWRKTNGLHPNALSSSQPAQNDLMPSPTVSTSCKKQKTLQLAGSMSLGAPSPTGRAPITSLTLKQSHIAGTSSKMHKLKVCSTAGSTGGAQLPGRGSSGTFAENSPTGEAKLDELIGRKVWARWPEDNFYEASDYDPLQIPGIIHTTGSRGHRAFKKSIPNAGSGRGLLIKGMSKIDCSSSRNGPGRMPFGDIQILHTDTLVKEVKRIFSVNPPDPAEIEKAKKVLKDQEQSLVDAITRLEDASDGESGNN